LNPINEANRDNIELTFKGMSDVKINCQLEILYLLKVNTMIEVGIPNGINVDFYLP